MPRFTAFAILVIFSPAVFAAGLYNPGCDYKDADGKCVSIDDGLFAIADARLNRLYKQVSAMLKKLDKTPDSASYFKPFLQSQRSWLKYRDDFCAFDSELSVLSISNMDPMEDNKACMAQLSDERSRQLLSIIRKYKTFSDELDEDGRLIPSFQ